MKQLIYSLIAFVMLCMGCATPKVKPTWADPIPFVPPKPARKSDVPKYIPWKESKGDTAAYLQQSFDSRKQYYIGRKFKVLLNDIEMSFSFCNFPTYYFKYKGREIIGGGGLFFSPESSYFGDIRGKNSFLLGVRFAPPYADENTVYEMMQRHDGEWWNEESRKLLEELIVTDIKYENLGTQK